MTIKVGAKACGAQRRVASFNTQKSIFVSSTVLSKLLEFHFSPFSSHGPSRSQGSVGCLSILAGSRKMSRKNAFYDDFVSPTLRSCLGETEWPQHTQIFLLVHCVLNLGLDHNAYVPIENKVKIQ